jgi:hypothetical protein
MHVIDVRNVNHALPAGLHYLKAYGSAQQSRNGPVLVAPGPVATVYRQPLERVLFNPVRNASPFFHFMESLWMLAGRDDVAFVAQYNKRMAEYSDNGITLHGAYGYRWRNWFGHDQLWAIIGELKTNPTSRRCVLSMWDGGGGRNHSADLTVATNGGKDVPCNTHAYFNIEDGMLRMTVCCRSNDAIWGAYGANAVHFSYLMEYIANCVGVEVGSYTQVSNNFHLYPEAPGVAEIVADGCEATYREYYSAMEDGTRPYIYKLVEVPKEFDTDLNNFMYQPTLVWNHANPVFKDIARPMHLAWCAYKSRYHAEALAHAALIVADDWRKACTDWLQRAIAKREAA